MPRSKHGFGFRLGVGVALAFTLALFVCLKLTSTINIASVRDITRHDCSGVMDADAFIFTLLRREDISLYTQRFAYVPSHIARLAFYGNGARLPVRVSRAGNVTAIRVPADNAYPPRELELRAMEFLSACIQPRVRFVIRLDLDAYISPTYIERLFVMFDGPLRKQSILGKPALGRPHEVGRLGFPKGTPYCMGGLGVTYGSGIIEDMRGRWRACLSNPASPHSDTEAQRCIFRATNTSCEGVPGGARLVNLHRRDARMRLPSESLISLVHADSYLANADVVHPLKDPREFANVLVTASLQLAPPITAQQLMRHYYAERRSVCVLNVFAQRQMSSCSADWSGDTCSFQPARCPPGPALHLGPPFVIPIYVLSISSPDRDRLFETTSNRLRRAGLPNIERALTSDAAVEDELGLVSEWARHTFHLTGLDDMATIIEARRLQGANASSTNLAYVPTMGEIAVRAAYKGAILRALETGAEYFVVADDDVVPSHTLQHQLNETLTSGCGRYMSLYAGILLLGASEWSNRWKTIDEMQYGGCYDVHDRTFGSFAVMYNRRGAMIALRELSSRPNVPFDHVFYQAALRGAFTAVTVPNMFIVDHRNKSSLVKPRQGAHDEMKIRTEHNRWNLSNYALIDDI